MVKIQLFGLAFEVGEFLEKTVPLRSPKFSSNAVTSFPSLGAVLFYMNKHIVPTASFITGN
jgi:hypothetical protein